jgi:hypothetical protein
MIDLSTNVWIRPSLDSDHKQNKKTSDSAKLAFPRYMSTDMVNEKFARQGERKSLGRYLPRSSLVMPIQTYVNTWS